MSSCISEDYDYFLNALVSHNLKFEENLFLGTHNSCANAVLSDPLYINSFSKKSTGMSGYKWRFMHNSKIVAGWALNQSESVYKQLELGARFIDVDVFVNRETGVFYTSHAVMTGLLENALDEIYHFATKNPSYKPSDVIILNICADKISSANKEEDAKFIDSLISFINNHRIASVISYKEPWGKTLYEIASAGNAYRNVVLAASRKKFKTTFPACIHSDDIIGRFIDTDSAQVKKSALFSELKSLEKADNQLYQLSWTLTPGTKTVVKGLLLPGTPRSVFELDKRLGDAADLNRFLTSSQNARKINIISVDYLCDDSLALFCRMENKRRSDDNIRKKKKSIDGQQEDDESNL